MGLWGTTLASFRRNVALERTSVRIGFAVSSECRVSLPQPKSGTRIEDYFPQLKETAGAQFAPLSFASPVPVYLPLIKGETEKTSSPLESAFTGISWISSYDL